MTPAEIARCAGKVRLDSARLAHEIMRRRRPGRKFDAGRRKDHRVGVYRCPHCGGWHLGSARSH